MEHTKYTTITSTTFSNTHDSQFSPCMRRRRRRVGQGWTEGCSSTHDLPQCVHQQHNTAHVGGCRRPSETMITVIHSLWWFPLLIALTEAAHRRFHVPHQFEKQSHDRNKLCLCLFMEAQHSSRNWTHLPPPPPTQFQHFGKHWRCMKKLTPQKGYKQDRTF